ncbi:MAG: hypothetical protein Q4E53_01260 [Eubacteriales bacterium]|nr:hypothetical protein [Eubacteriales bacterium]
MKKITFASVTFAVTVVNHYSFRSEVACGYGKDVIAYATERFLCRFGKFKHIFARECWKARVAERKRRTKYSFEYIVPASLMELPGNWVRLKGKVDGNGANIYSIELLKIHPVLKKESLE